MKKSLSFAAMTGLSAIALLMPVLVPVSSAQSASSTSSVVSGPKPPSVQELIARDQATLTYIDAHKTAVNAHLTALNAAALLTDPAAQKAAVEKANQDMRAAIDALMKNNPSMMGGGMMQGGKPSHDDAGHHQNAGVNSSQTQSSESSMFAKFKHDQQVQGGAPHGHDHSSSSSVSVGSVGGIQLPGHSEHHDGKQNKGGHDHQSSSMQSSSSSSL